MRIEEKEGRLVIVDFNELEAYKIADKIERDGIEFYTKLAQEADDEKLRSTLELMAGQERDHLKSFHERLEEIREERGDAFEEDDLLNYFDYGIFQPYRSMAELEKAIDSPRRALRLGIIVEDKSINFYSSCLGKIQSRNARKELSRILDEERRHKKTLEEMLAGLA